MSAAGFLEKLLDGADVSWVPLEEVATIKHGRDWKHLNEGDIPVYGSGGIMGYVDDYSYDKPTVLIPRKGSITNIFYVETPLWNVDTIYYTEIDESKIVPKFFYYFICTLDMMSMDTGSGRPSLTQSILNQVEVPVPCPDDPEKSLAIQAEIVRILDSFTQLTAELTAELTQRKKQYNHYRDQLLTFDEDEVEWKTLGQVFNLFAGGDKPKDAFSDVETEEFNVPVLSNGIGKKSQYGWTSKAKIEEPSLTVSARGTIGWTSYRDRPIFPIIRLLVLTPKGGINLRYAYHYMKTIEGNYKVPDSGIPQLTKPMIERTLFPVPFPDDPKKSLKEQARIVAILDTFDTLTTSVTEGLPCEIALREKQYAWYRDLLLSFPKPDEMAA